MADVQLALNTKLMTLGLITYKPIFINVSTGLVSSAIYTYLSSNHHGRRFGFGFGFGFKDKLHATDYKLQLVAPGDPQQYSCSHEAPGTR